MQTPPHYFEAGVSLDECWAFCLANEGCTAIEYVAEDRACRRFGRLHLALRPGMQYVGVQKLHDAPLTGDGDPAYTCVLKGTPTPSPTPTFTPTATASATPTATAAATRTSSGTGTGSLTHPPTRTLLPTVTKSPTTSFAPRLCGEGQGPTAGAGVWELRPGGKCLQAVVLGRGSDALFSRSIRIRVLELLHGRLKVCLVKGCVANASDCPTEWSSPHGPTS